MNISGKIIGISQKIIPVSHNTVPISQIIINHRNQCKSCPYVRKLDPFGESLEHISKYNFSFTTCRPIDATSITKSYVHVLQSIIVDFVPHGIANLCCQITHIIYRQKSLSTRKAKIITFLVSLQITVLYNHKICQ